MNNRIVTYALVLLLTFFVIFLRVRAVSLTHLDNLARATVLDENYRKVQKAINDGNAFLPQNKREKLISKYYQSFTKQNRYLIEKKIKEKALERKAFYQNDNNHTYIFGIDSYYWLRLIDNLRRKGHIGDRIVDGQNHDDLIGMPIEQSLSKSAHIILGSLIYKFFDYFKLDIDYESGLYLLPLIFSALLAVLTFYTTKLLCKSNAAAFFAVLAVNLSPLFLQRSMGEWLDTDIYNIILPLLIFGSFLFVFKNNSTVRRTLGLITFSLACASYASIWQGWWHIFDLLILSGLVYILNDYFSEGRESALFKKNILWLSLLFVFGVLFTGLFNGRESCLGFIFEPGKLIFALKDVPKDNWPNVFLTVAELKKVSPYRIAMELGGLFLFFVSILGAIYFVIFEKIIRDKELGIGFFCLFIWLGALYYTSLNAIRFAMLLIVPLGIMFGIVFDRLLRLVFNFSLKFPKKVHFPILGILIVAIYFFTSFYIKRGADIATYKIPIINDTWYKSLKFIKDNPDKDAVINSWWDYGHWFKAIAQRKVLFDGKTQNSPVAYWMARVLTTDDEEEALGILRMLDLSKNEAFDLLESYGFSHYKAINTLKEIIKLPESEARKHLEGTLDKEKIDKLILLLFNAKIPPGYFIASYDMMGKMGAISHIGNWDFQRGDIWINLSKSKPYEFINYLKKEHNYTNEDANALWQQLRMLSNKEALGWISRINTINMDSFSGKFKKDDNLLIFDNDLVLDLSNFKAYMTRGRGLDIGIPYSVVYMKDGLLAENKLENSNMDYSVLLFSEGEDSYRTVFMDKDLSKSMFTRMYFLKGEGLKYFKKVLEEKTPEGNSVIVYTIEWPK